MVIVFLFGASTLASLAATFIVFAMIGEVNRKKGGDSQIQYFHFSWIRVFREYRALYPHGLYTKALIVAVCLTCVLFLIFIYHLFGAFQQQALPSR
jgi:hypothetical protein